MPMLFLSVRQLGKTTCTCSPRVDYPNPLPAPPHQPLCSRLALGVKLTLDQVLGFALWHAALAAIHEPHRATCLALMQRPAAASGAKAR